MVSGAARLRRRGCGSGSLIFDGDILLLVAFQVAGLLGALAHDLHGIHYALRNVEISIAKSRGPGQTRRPSVSGRRQTASAP